jgi:hypothetical protein
MARPGLIDGFSQINQFIQAAAQSIPEQINTPLPQQ